MGIYIEDTREQADVYKEGALVKGRMSDSYGILVIASNKNQVTYNVIGLPTDSVVTKPFLKHRLTYLTMQDVKELYEVVASPSEYNVTITIGD